LLSLLPSGSGYTEIYSTGVAFATLKADGSIMAWGSPYAGGTGAPSGSSYTKIYSTGIAFAALKTDERHPPQQNAKDQHP
jgi:hypothetical protein